MSLEGGVVLLLSRCMTIQCAQRSARAASSTVFEMSKRLVSRVMRRASDTMPLGPTSFRRPERFTDFVWVARQGLVRGGCRREAGHCKRYEHTAVKFGWLPRIAARFKCSRKAAGTAFELSMPWRGCRRAGRSMWRWDQRAPCTWQRFAMVSWRCAQEKRHARSTGRWTIGCSVSLRWNGACGLVRKKGLGFFIRMVVTSPYPHYPTLGFTLWLNSRDGSSSQPREVCSSVPRLWNRKKMRQWLLLLSSRLRRLEPK